MTVIAVTTNLPKTVRVRVLIKESPYEDHKEYIGQEVLATYYLEYDDYLVEGLYMAKRYLELVSSPVIVNAFGHRLATLTTSVWPDEANALSDLPDGTVWEMKHLRTGEVVRCP